MSVNTIMDGLKDIISQELDANIAREEIGDDTPLFEEGLGLDSVTLVELIALVEKKFGINFSDDELYPEAFSTIKVLADNILDKQG
ncbi:MAG: acyl carrier protein [Gammaproteobacteria bacterium]|nr:acyl carrier protein [Gammaproteobacteria bacterium]